MKSLILLMMMGLAPWAVAQMEAEDAVSTSVESDETSQLPFQYSVFMGLEGQVEQGANPEEQEGKIHKLLGLRVQKEAWRFQTEFNLGKEEAGEGYISVKTYSYSWMNWAQYVFLRDRPVPIYLGGGLGVSLYRTQTRAALSSRTDYSDINVDWGLSVGIEHVFTVGAIRPLAIGGEVRLLALERTKDPFVSGLLFLSYIF